MLFESPGSVFNLSISTFSKSDFKLAKSSSFANDEKSTPVTFYFRFC